jgi:hypothetical protein
MRVTGVFAAIAVPIFAPLRLAEAIFQVDLKHMARVRYWHHLIMLEPLVITSDQRSLF